MYEKTLEQIGLSPNQAIIYETLVKNGTLTASKVSQKTPLKRGLVYKTLDELVDLNIVEKKEDPGKVAVFKSNHPFKLKDLTENRAQKAGDAIKILDSLLPSITSDYNLTTGRPGVKFYEGKRGIIKIYEELLVTNERMDSIEDKGEMADFIPEYSNKYPNKRVKNNIFNRVIAPADTPINKNDPEEMRETHFIPTKIFPFRMDIKIIADLVSIITFQQDNPIGILIKNKEVADNYRLLFELIWNLTSTQQKQKIKLV